MRISDWSSDVCSSDLRVRGDFLSLFFLPSLKTLVPLLGVRNPGSTYSLVILGHSVLLDCRGWILFPGGPRLLEVGGYLDQRGLYAGQGVNAQIGRAHV